MKKKILITYDSDTGVAHAMLRTKHGVFYGDAKISPKDPFPPSYSIGTRIAEGRAYVKYYNKCIYEKKLELKGVKRLLFSTSSPGGTFDHILNMYNTINNELLELKQEKEEALNLIKFAIESREMYLRSRLTDRKAKKEYLNNLAQAIKTLEMVNSDKKD